MPYRYGNFSYVADTSFNPFQSLQQMLVPFSAYKDAYEKTEAAYDDLNQKTDTFSYLEQVAKDKPESKAAKIYKNYADEMHTQFEDFSKHGLSMGNRRSLLNLKKRYKGEIGKLEAAKTAMDEEKKRRRNNKDTSMLYAEDNLDIDQFLDGNNPNLYEISGNELYTKGAAIGKGFSSRVYATEDGGKTLGGFYRDFITRKGYTPEQIAKFQDQILNDFASEVSAIPELQQAATSLLEANGVPENLKGSNLRKAQQQVIRGIVDNAIFEEKHTPTRDLGVPSWSERRADARANAAHQLAVDKFNYEKATSGITVNPDGTVSYDPSKDAAYQRMKKLSEEGDVSGYKFNPATGKYVKDTEAAAEAKKEKAAEDKKGIALMKLDRSTLASSAGFDVAFGNDRHHYDWMGALSKHGGKWYSGKEGQDNPGHWGWGFASTSNVENWWGNFTYEPGDNAKMRILSQSEIQSLMGNTEIAEQINKQLYESGYYNNSILSDLMKSQSLSREKAIELLDKNGYKYTNDVQIAAVNSERPNKDEENYLVAVRTK